MHMHTSIYLLYLSSYPSPSLSPQTKHVALILLIMICREITVPILLYT